MTVRSGPTIDPTGPGPDRPDRQPNQFRLHSNNRSNTVALGGVQVTPATSVTSVPSISLNERGFPVSSGPSHAHPGPHRAISSGRLTPDNSRWSPNNSVLVPRRHIKPPRCRRPGVQSSPLGRRRPGQERRPARERRVGVGHPRPGSATAPPWQILRQWLAAHSSRLTAHSHRFHPDRHRVRATVRRAIGRTPQVRREWSNGQCGGR